MTVLSWAAVLVGAWCAMSVCAALGMGALLRRSSRIDAQISRGSDMGVTDSALAMWLAELPREVPDTPRDLVEFPSQRTPHDTPAGLAGVPSRR